MAGRISVVAALRMLFNSYVFLFLFLPVAVAGFYLLGRGGNMRAAALWLTVASFFFYGWWNPAYLPLFAISIVVNYWIGVGINNARHGRLGVSPKALLTFGVVLNLGALGYYKYANFFVDNARHFLGAQWQVSFILLPLAISFFTFTQIAYLVDAYHGVTEEYDFLWYAFFVSFFPHLIAGPIVSYRRLMPQFAQAETYRFQAENMAAGLSMFVMGLGKKVLIADSLSIPSTTLFDDPTLVPGLITSWVGALAYTFQLYFDFSAYSDMAIGLARMFNVRFPLNFNSPYKAMDISDFWRRWHMTLSHFLRDHLYIPLGGNRHGEPRRYLNLMITMVLGGFWHGAGWTFLVWGGLHGVYLIVHHAWQRQTKNLAWTQGWIFSAAGWALTFLAVLIGWVFFRAHSFLQAGSILKGMLGLHGIGLPENFAPPHAFAGLHAAAVVAAPSLHGQQITYLLLAAVIAFFAPNTDEIFRVAERYSDQSHSEGEGRLWRLNPFWALGTAVVLTVCVLNLSSVSEFLYFKF
jgi:alginate O-acetyltransferase complex protein AlgI